MIKKIAAFLGRHRAETVLFGVSFALHLLASIFLYSKFGSNVLFFQNEDAYGYVALAKSIASGHGFLLDGVPSAIRTPAFPLLLALVYLLHLPDTWAILILQNIVATLAGIFLFKCGALLFNRRVGFIAAGIYIVEPYMLMTANLATTETFFNFLIILAVYFLARWYVEPRYRWLGLSACVLGIATLTRPVTLYLPFVVSILVAIRLIMIHKLNRLRRVVATTGLLFGIFFLTLTPWSLREYRLFGTPRITNIDAVMLYFRVAPLVVAAEQNMPYPKAIDRLQYELKDRYPQYVYGSNIHDFTYYHFMVGRTRDLVADRPTVVMRSYMASLVPALFGTGYEYMLEEVLQLKRAAVRPSYSELFLHEGIYAFRTIFKSVDIFLITTIFSMLLWAVVYVIIFCALIRRAAWQQDAWPLVLLLALAAYFIFFTLGPAIHARYRLPSLPFLYLLFAYGIDFLRKKFYYKPTASPQD